MLNDLINLRNRKQPKGMSNTDNLMYDYKFWTEVERDTKKAREQSKQTMLSASEKPTTAGIVLASQKYKCVLEVSEPVRQFNLEVFINSIMTTYPKLSKPKLRELATAAVVPTKPRMTYKVEEANGL